MESFLASGRSAATKIKGCSVPKTAKTSLSGGLPIPTDPYGIRKKLPIDCVKFLLLPLRSLLAAQ